MTVLSIPQLETAETQTTAPLLPSFLYYPTPAEMDAGLSEKGFRLDAGIEAVIAGRFARQQAATLPGRVIHSAKSWLCHGGVDREGRILPWQSEEIPAGKRLSPVSASACLLGILASAWKDHFSGMRGATPDFEQQEIIVTVPASFDEAAQSLTREAAGQAGFPKRIRLIEEPQAAFYHWLEKKGDSRTLLSLLPVLREKEQHVLICDIGGGTSDFSLFCVDPLSSEEKHPSIKRVAVSDHLLLGGDNIDLALSHEMETRLLGTERKLTSRQWSFLVAEMRRLKERVLSRETAGECAQPDPAESYTVAVPGTGASLLAESLSAVISRDEIRERIAEGFFPLCSADARPSKPAGGFKEMGLPYPRDPAITHHLAAFLRGRRIDAVLFNGGTLKPLFLQQRMTDTLAAWQEGSPPLNLFNDDLDLSVARGAACYGKVLRQPFGRISGGYPHSVYLELQAPGKKAAPRLLCILPKGFEEGQTVRIDSLDLKLILGKPVRFQPYYSNYRPDDTPGEIVNLDEEEFHPLPPLQTQVARREGMEKQGGDRVEIFLETTLTELGLLEVTCIHSGDSGDYRWDLSFNLRRPSEAEAGSDEINPEVSARQLEQGVEAIEAVFGKKKTEATDKVKPRRLQRDLQTIFGRERTEWNLALLRSLWHPLHKGMTRKGRSVDHEATWLNLAGFVLRPGYGAELDPIRMEELWRLNALQLAFPREKRIVNQLWILWRRTAGGLDSEQQAEILKKILPPLRNKTAEGAEIFRLAGSLERIDLKIKAELAKDFVSIIKEGRAKGSIADPIWALGRILGRIPLYAGPDAVLAPSMVEKTFGELQDLDWSAPSLQGLNEAFSNAARVTGIREKDISSEVRSGILKKLEISGASEKAIRVVREYVPVEQADQVSLFGESLPAGLVLAKG